MPSRFVRHLRRLAVPAAVGGVFVLLAWFDARWAPPPAGRRERLDALTPERVARVRADPAAARGVYDECRGELAADLGRRFDHFTDADLRLVFCTILAYSVAPYGPSNVVELPDLLAAPTLNCGNYPNLMSRLHELVGDGDGPAVCIVGWDGGAVGNHGMGYRPHPNRDRAMFLDPTVGLIALGTFDEVASGKALGPDRVVSFGDRPADTAFQARVAGAFVYGRFKPSDLLYYYEDLAHMLRHGGRDRPTPAAVGWRRAHPVPPKPAGGKAP